MGIRLFVFSVCYKLFSINLGLLVAWTGNCNKLQAERSSCRCEKSRSRELVLNSFRGNYQHLFTFNEISVELTALRQSLQT